MGSPKEPGDKTTISGGTEVAKPFSEIERRNAYGSTQRKDAKADKRFGARKLGVFADRTALTKEKRTSGIGQTLTGDPILNVADTAFRKFGGGTKGGSWKQ